MAYKTISRLDKWKLLYNYQVVNNRGFMFSDDEEIRKLMGAIEEDYGGHSGASLGFTMRHLQFISYYGVSRYIRLIDMQN